MGSKRRYRTIKASPSPLLYIVALILAGGLLFVLKNVSQSRASGRLPSPRKALMVLRHLPKASSSRANNEPKLADVYNKKLLAAGTTESKFGVGTLAPKVSKGRMTIPFVFKTERKWCTPGDLDTILKTVKNKSSKELLVTLENISDKTVHGKFRMSVNDLIKGNNLAFITAASSHTESLGLFICRDTNRSGSCQSKEIMSQDEISRQLAANRQASSKKDYVYYFQNVLLSNGKLQIYRSANAEISMAPGLQDFLESTYNLKEVDFQRATQLNSTIRSVPAMIIDKRILLTLPYNDPSCVASMEGRSARRFVNN